MQHDEPGSCFVKMDHRLSAVTVKLELEFLDAPWYALKADAMALDSRATRLRLRLRAAMAMLRARDGRRDWRLRCVWARRDEVVMQALG